MPPSDVWDNISGSHMVRSSDIVVPTVQLQVGGGGRPPSSSLWEEVILLVIGGGT
jgi:hypothetical protein